MPDETSESNVVQSAPVDAALADRLGAPSSVAALYLEEASLFRPIATGDVFREACVPGTTDDEASWNLTMVVAHPSAMRRGAILEERAQAAPVYPIAGVKRTEWTANRYDIFPLPGIREVAKANGFEIDKKAWATDLRLSGPVETAAFDLRQRVACLAPEGVILLLQRLVHTDTRAAVRLDTLRRVFAPKMDEIEPLETWTEDIVSALDPDQDAVFDAIAAAHAQFDDFLATVDERLGLPVRALLESDEHPGEARRLITAEIRRRREELAG